jgi:hypothetical protein
MKLSEIGGDMRTPEELLMLDKALEEFMNDTLKMLL